MQIVVDSLRQKGKIFKKMQEIPPKELGIRNKIKLFKATHKWLLLGNICYKSEE